MFRWERFWTSLAGDFHSTLCLVYTQVQKVYCKLSNIFYIEINKKVNFKLTVESLMFYWGIIDIQYYTNFGYRTYLFNIIYQIRSYQIIQSCLTLCDPMNRSTPGLPVQHHLPEFTKTHVHRVSDAIQPSHPLSSPSPPAPNPSQHQSLFQWVNSLHEVAKVLEFQL